MKSIYLVILTLFISIPICGQTTNTIEKATEKEKTLEQIRQDFWDNIPKTNNLTNDYEGLFSKEEQTNLNGLIRKFEQETTIEIGLVTLDTSKTALDKFDDLTLHIAETWQVGKKESNNGIIIAISKGYRKLRIQYGDGIQKIITDTETKELINTNFVPDFKKGNYYDGTFNGITALIQLLKSKNTVIK